MQPVTIKQSNRQRADQQIEQQPRFKIVSTQRSASYALYSGVLLMALILAGCGKSSVNAAASSQPANQISISAPGDEVHNASIALQPASGYGGLYIQVGGDNWPRNMMVLVTVEDEQGRSETLAASDTDANGTLATGFLFPIDQRWLASETLWVVATTADGRTETKSRFDVVDPGTPIAAGEGTGEDAGGDAVAGGDSDVTGAENDANNNEASAQLGEQADHTLTLPLIANPGAERRATNRAATSATASVTSSGAIQVDVDVYADGAQHIDCRNGEAWITVAIYSGNGFDATRIDPGSVSVSGGVSDLGYSGNAGVELVTFRTGSKAEAAARSRQAYQWMWQHNDANGDGTVDLVMEFRLDYTALDCNATAVYVSGRTKDGTTFEGTSHADMVVLERS